MQIMDSFMKSTPKHAVSPSMITDFFKSSKSSQNRKRGKADAQKEVAVSSVYLTPESSPGSLSNPENDAKQTSSHENVHAEPIQNLQLCAEASELNESPVCAPQPDDLHTEIIPTSPAKEKNENTDVKNFTETKTTSDISPVTSIDSQLTGQCSVDKVDGQKEKTLCNQTTKTAMANSSSDKNDNTNSPAIVAFQSLDRKGVSSPPSLPKLKLRKSARSNTQADAAAAVKDGDSLKPKPGRRKKKEPEPVKNKVITDYFQVRRSGRQTKSEIEKEKQHQLEQMILSGCQDGLEVKEFKLKGRGVVATKDFKKGDFVVEYAGDLIDLATAKEREEKYAKNTEVGCYMYYFKCGSKQHCVDATAESGKLGRLLNHSSKDGNCCTRSLEVKGVARLILVAKRDISSGEELTYDYGDRSKASLESHPWLKL